MLIRAYLPKFLTALFGGIFIAAGILTFGNGVIFDQIFFGILIFTGIICRKNINVVTIVVILFLQLLLDKIAWHILLDSYLTKITLYSIALLLVYYFRFDLISKLILVSLLIVCAAEAYWFVNEYAAPQIYWHIWIMCSSILTRYFLFSRVSIIEHFFDIKGESINLDWIIYKLTAATILLQAAMIFEYILRHIFGFSGLLAIYIIYPYLIQVVSTLYIWSTFNESYKQLIPNFLKA